MNELFPGSAPHHPGRLHAFMGRCQELAWRIHELEPGALIAEARQAVLESPEEGCFADQLLARAVLGEILAALVRRAAADREPEIGLAFLRLATAHRSDEWKQQALAIVEDCSAAIARQRQLDVSQMPVLVRQALEILNTQYADKLLDEPAVGSAVGVSASHLGRQLRKHTGKSFPELLHERRIAVVHARLLAGARESLDAIAERAGYSSAKQLRRHFRARYGVTPQNARAGKMRPQHVSRRPRS